MQKYQNAAIAADVCITLIEIILSSEFWNALKMWNKRKNIIK